MSNTIFDILYFVLVSIWNSLNFNIIFVIFGIAFVISLFALFLDKKFSKKNREEIIEFGPICSNPICEGYKIPKKVHSFRDSNGYLRFSKVLKGRSYCSVCVAAIQDFEKYYNKGCDISELNKFNEI